MSAEDRYLSVAEVAARIGSSPRFVLDELRRKKLRGSKLHEWRIAESDLKAYLDAKANVRPVRRAS